MSLDLDKLKKRMESDLARALTSKTELFCRDDLNSGLTVEDLTSMNYREWLAKTRFSHLLIVNIVDMLESKNADEYSSFSDYYLTHDSCICLYKARKIGPKKFYADFARWMACDWAQVRIDSRDLDGYKTQTDPPSVQTKIADIARKLIAHEDDLLTDEETMFLVRVFDEIWCRPLDHEIPWKSHCACPYERNNVAPHHHRCSYCGRTETKSGELKLCGRCNQCEYGKFFKRYYCGVNCQKSHWADAHKMYHQNVDNLLKGNWSV